jgi:uncharacterized SAM-binding protein YcdF (DUF218 family)
MGDLLAESPQAFNSNSEVPEACNLFACRCGRVNHSFVQTEPTKPAAVTGLAGIRERPAEELARVLWNYHRVVGELAPVDAIIGLGSYDLRVARWCAALMQRGLAPVLVFTGAHGNWTRGRWARSEAEDFADEAVAGGAPRERLLLETSATNIGENLRFTKALLAGRSHPARRVIVVTKPQTLRRVAASAPIFWPEATVITSCPDHAFAEQPTPEHSIDDLINEMVGDVQRMIEYPGLGYQVAQETPPEVLAAYEELKARGYTRHLLARQPDRGPSKSAPC